MSTQIENRIVQMGFQGEQFEKGVHSSLKALDDLKEGLQFKDVGKGFEKINRASNSVNFDGIVDSLEYIASRVSPVARVFDEFFTGIVRRAVYTGERMISALTIDPIYTGWEKYGEKTASVQTIMNATGKTIDEVNGYLDKLMWFSDETSYSFTDMTSSLGQLTSSGADIDKMIPMIMGIANATAFAGKGTAEFSRAIYNLNQSYAAGALQYIDFKSLEQAGVASKQLKEIFIQVGEEVGTISKGEVTLENFSSTLTKMAWANTEVMEKAFGIFGEMSEKAYQMVKSGEVDTASEAYEILAKRYDTVSLTAAKAAQEAKTFREAIAATQDAVASGWMRTYEAIFGNYEEAKVLWTALANELWEKFAGSADQRNELILAFKGLGGVQNIINGIGNAWDGMWMVINDIKTAFHDIFPPVTAETLFNISKRFADLCEWFIYGTDLSDKLQRVFRGLFSIVDIGVMVFKSFAGVVQKALVYLAPYASKLGNLVVQFADYIYSVRNALKTTSAWELALNWLTNTIQVSREKIEEAILGIRAAFENYANTIKSKLSFFKGKKKDTGLSGFIEKIKEQTKWLTNYKESVPKIVETISAMYQKAFTWLKEAMYRTLDTVTLDKVINTFTGVLSVGFLGAIAKFVSDLRKFPKKIESAIKGSTGPFKYFRGIIDGFVKHFHGVLDSVQKVLDGVRKSLEAWQLSIKAKAIMDIGKAVATLAGAILVLSLIPIESLGTALGAITVLFVELVGSLMILSKAMKTFDIKKSYAVVKVMQGMGVSMLILSISVKSLSKLDWEGLGKGLLGLAGMMGLAFVALKGMSTITRGISKISAGLIIFGVALRVLVISVKALSKLGWEELAKGLIGVGSLLAAIAGFLLIVGNTKVGAFKATGIILIATSLIILSKAVSIFGNLNEEQLAKGFLGVAGVLTGLAVFLNLVSGAKKIFSIAIAMNLIGASLLIFGKAISNIGSLSWEQIGKGLGVIAAMLIMVAGGLRLMPKGMLGIALQLMAVAESFKMLIKPVVTLSALSLDAIGRGLIAFSGSLAIVAIGMRLMPSATEMAGADAGLMGFAIALSIFAGAFNKLAVNSWDEVGMKLLVLIGSLTAVAAGMAMMRKGLPGALAMLVMSGAIAMFVPALMALSKIPVMGIVVALGALVGLFAVLGIAAAVLTPVIAPILLLSSAIAILGVACVGIGAGLTLVATGLATLAGIGAAGVLVLTNTIKSAVDLIPMVLKKVAEGIIAFATTITENSIAVTNAFTTLFVAIITSIKDNTVSIASAFGDLIIAFLNVIQEYFPTVAEAGANILLTLLSGIASHIGDVVTTVSDIVINFLNGLAEKLPDIINAGIALMYAFIHGLNVGIQENMEPIVQEIMSLGWNIVEGLIKGIGSGIGNVWNKVQELGSTVLNSLMDKLKMHSPSRAMEELGGLSIDGFVNGITGKNGEVSGAMSDIGSGLLGTLGQYTSQLPSEGENAMSGLIGAFSTGSPEIGTNVSEGLTKALSAVDSSGEQFFASGSNIMTQLINGIQSKSNELRIAVSSIVQAIIREIANTKPKFFEQGQQLISAIANGAKSRVSHVIEASNAIGDAMLSAIGGYVDKMFSAGANAAIGFANGLESEMDRVRRASSDLGSDAMDGISVSLDMHSPSRVFFKFGKFVDMGFANGIEHFSYFSSYAAKGLSDETVKEFNSAVRRISDTIDSDLEASPTIRPIVDLSNVRSASEQINDMIGSTPEISLEKPVKVVSTVSETVKATKEPPAIQNGVETERPIEQIYTFNQYNTSPKALSRVEIYRQTKNQFSSFKEATRRK